MQEHSTSRALQPGDRAPGFVLPAVNREGDVSLEDYLGRAPLFLALYRGLYCPFCRRHLATLSALYERLETVGVKMLAVVNTLPERARLYFRYHPTPVLLAADAERRIYEAFGVVRVADSDTADWPRKATQATYMAMRLNPTGELPEPMSPIEFVPMLNAKDGYEVTEEEMRIGTAGGTQLCGQFLIDRDGVVQWTFIEAEKDPADMSQYPSGDQVLAVAAALVQ